MRLSTVLICMGLILVSGLVTTHSLEARSGGSMVPGIVVVEAPWLGAEQLVDLLDTWPDGALEHVSCAPGALQPFGARVVGRRAVAGDRTILFANGAPMDAEAVRRDARGDPVWTVVLDSARAVPRSVAEPTFADAAAFIRAQRDVRPFTVGLMPSGAEQTTFLEGLHRLYAALESLPRYRGGSLVVLGGPWQSDAVDGQGLRPALRIDRPAALIDRRPGLRDLLEPGA